MLAQPPGEGVSPSQIALLPAGEEAPPKQGKTRTLAQPLFEIELILHHFTCISQTLPAESTSLFISNTLCEVRLTEVCRQSTHTVI